MGFQVAPELERLIAENRQDNLLQGSCDTLPDVAEAVENLKVSQFSGSY